MSLTQTPGVIALNKILFSKFHWIMMIVAHPTLAVDPNDMNYNIIVGFNFLDKYCFHLSFLKHYSLNIVQGTLS